MIVQSMCLERLGVALHKSATLVVVGVEKYHVVAETDEESLVIWVLYQGLIHIVEYDVGHEE